jgi:hypothetical protein
MPSTELQLSVSYNGRRANIRCTIDVVYVCAAVWLLVGAYSLWLGDEPVIMFMLKHLLNAYACYFTYAYPELRW